jgi:hypothetical protein
MANQSEVLGEPHIIINVVVVTANSTFIYRFPVDMYADTFNNGRFNKKKCQNLVEPDLKVKRTN